MEPAGPIHLIDVGSAFLKGDLQVPILLMPPSGLDLGGDLLLLLRNIYGLHAFLELQDVQLMQAWVRDLQEFGLQLPDVGRKMYNGLSYHSRFRCCSTCSSRS